LYTLTSSFSFYADRPHRVLHSFPTRRSSDLVDHVGLPAHDIDGAVVPAAELQAVEAVVRDGGAGAGGHGDLQAVGAVVDDGHAEDRKSTRLNSSHDQISYAVFCLKKKKKKTN